MDCEDCGGDMGLGIHGGKRFCGGCAKIRRRLQARESYHRRKVGGVAKVVGGVQPCISCGATITVKGNSHRYCVPCARDLTSINKRSYVNRKRLES